MRSLGSAFILTLIFSMCLVGIRQKALADPACRSTATKTALFIVDMQTSYVTSPAYEPWAEHDQHNLNAVRDLTAAQSAAISAIKEHAREHNVEIPIIFMNWENHGDTTYQLTQAVGDYQPTVTLFKKILGAFDQPNVGDPNYQNRQRLVQYLQDNSIRNLIIMGINGPYCVTGAISGAVGENCNVSVYTPGIADFSRERDQNNNRAAFEYPYDGQQYYPRLREYCAIGPHCGSITEITDIETLKESLPNE